MLGNSKIVIMKGNVLEGRILVKEITPEETTSSGVIIPAVVQDQRKATVEIAGNETKIGDVVYFNNSKVRSVKLYIDDEWYLLLRESDVLYIE